MRLGPFSLLDLGEETPTVLVVDDMPENGQLLARLLRPKGFTVVYKCDGREALRYVDQHPPDVIVLDLMMPGMSGYEVCETLKLNPNTRHIPIIVVTGMAEKEANIRALESGADDFLRKPFDTVLLECRLRTSVRSKRLQDQIFDYKKQLEATNENLEDVVQQRTMEVVRTQQVTVFSLAKLAESRDNETGEHLERMRCYTREVAEELLSSDKYLNFKNQLDDAFVADIYQSSPLHDIGKVGIPDSILLKPGKLTTDEFDVMKSHTLIGGNTLQMADEEAGEDGFLSMGRDIAFFHHEKWDGSGYPYGIKEEAIPPAARIVAISDVYDALSSRRPYKEPFPHEKCMAILADGRGQHFDPDVVDAFVAREERVLEIRGRFQETGMLAPIEQLAQKPEEPLIAAGNGRG